MYKSIINEKKIETNDTTLSDIVVNQQSKQKNRVKQIVNLLNLRKKLRNQTLNLMLHEKYPQAALQSQKVLIQGKNIKEILHKIPATYNLFEYYQNTSIIFLADIEFLMDFLIHIKILSKRGEKLSIRRKIYDMQFLNFQPIPKNLDVKQTNILHKQITAYQSILKGLILITIDLDLVQTTEKLYDQYVLLIKKHQGQLELASVYFQYGNFYFNLYNKDNIPMETNPTKKEKNVKYQHPIRNKYTGDSKALLLKAKFYIELSRQIRIKYGYNLGYADTLTNLAFIEFQFRNKAITKQYLNLSIRIKLDHINNQNLKQKIDCSRQYEMLGKILLEEGEFVSSYQNFKKCYEIKKWYKQKQLQIQRKRIQVLIIFLFRTLYTNSYYSIGKRKEECKSLMDKIEKEMFQMENFSYFKIYKNNKIDRLQLKISLQTFESLTQSQIFQYQNIQKQIKNYTFSQAINSFLISDFYRNLGEYSKDQIDQNIKQQLEQFKKMDFVIVESKKP